MIQYNLIIIDGNNLASVSFFAFRNLSARIKGEEVRTGSVFGFFDRLIDLKKNYLKPDGRIIATWDMGYGKRRSIYPEYKGNREVKKGTEEFENLGIQMGRIKELLLFTSISSAFIPNQEADDTIASLVELNTYHKRKKNKSLKGTKVLIVSGDGDLNQLIGENVHQLLIGRRKKNLLHLGNYEKEFGIEAHEVLLKKMLQGDSSDNITGIEKVGPKTAVKFINQFSNTEKMLLLKGKGIIPAALGKWLVKRNRNQEEIKKLLVRNWKLMNLNGYMKGIKIRRGKPTPDKLEAAFEEMEMQSLLRPTIFKLLVG